MRIAITGATGFIGGYLARGLARLGYDLRLLVRPGREGALPVLHPGRPEDHRNSNAEGRQVPRVEDRGFATVEAQAAVDVEPAAEVNASVEIHRGDLRDPSSLRGFLTGVDLLLHAASLHDHFSETETQAVNIRGTEVLLEEASLHAAKHFRIFIISSAVIGAPVYSYYRDSKRVQEKIIRGSGIEWASFRPTLVYGKGDVRHTAPLLRRCAAKRGTLWVPHDGLSKINPVHVEDVVEAVVKFFDFDRGVDCVYELAGPFGIPYNEFLDLTIQVAGGGVKRRNISKKWADRFIFMKGLFTDNTSDRRASAYFNLHHEHDITNATFELGWKPRSYAEGIAQVAQGDWWRQAVPSEVASPR